MSEPQNDGNGNIEILANLGRALKYAEKEEAQGRHGSSSAEYHNARLLAEGFASQFAGVTVKALRDRADNTGIDIILPYHGKDRCVAVTFEELQHSNPDPEQNEALYERWHKVIRSSASIVPEPEIVQSTARKSAKSKVVRGKAQ